MKQPKLRSKNIVSEDDVQIERRWVRQIQEERGGHRERMREKEREREGREKGGGGLDLRERERRRKREREREVRERDVERKRGEGNMMGCGQTEAKRFRPKRKDFLV